MGLDPDHDIDGPSVDFPIPSSFALASRITGLPFPRDAGPAVPRRGTQ
ncbi:hypothetical protein [Streptosporangium roseum]|nr:hypothetical protein [Streptosporangium roseum]